MQAGKRGQWARPASVARPAAKLRKLEHGSGHAGGGARGRRARWSRCGRSVASEYSTGRRHDDDSTSAAVG